MRETTVAISLSALSLVIALLSLGWQVAVHWLTAGRPKAVLMTGIETADGRLVHPVRQQGSALRPARIQGVPGKPIVGVQVANHGRLPITVDAVTFHIRGGSVTYMVGRDPMQSDLPHKVEPGANASWYMDATQVRMLAGAAVVAEKLDKAEVYAVALLGSGQQVETSESMPIEYDQLH